MNDDRDDRAPNKIQRFLEDLEADLDVEPGKVLTSAVELGVDSGWTTSQMTQEELAKIVGSDIRNVDQEDSSSHEATSPHELWATAKMSRYHDHLLALSNPNRVPDPEQLEPHGATTRMTHDEMHRALEDSKHLDRHAQDSTRNPHSTPVERPQGRISTLRPDIPASQSSPDPPYIRGPRPDEQHAKPTRFDPWTALALVSICVLIALLAYLGLR